MSADLARELVNAVLAAVEHADDGNAPNRVAEAALAAAEERGRRRGVEEAADAAEKYVPLISGPAALALAREIAIYLRAKSALAPRDSAPVCDCGVTPTAGMHGATCAQRKPRDSGPGLKLRSDPRFDPDDDIAPRDSAPARYCDAAHPAQALRCGRFVQHDGPHTAFTPSFDSQNRVAVHWEDRK